MQGANLTQVFEDVEGSLALKLQQSGSRPPSQESCPQDVFTVIQETRHLHLLKSINTSAFDQPVCVSNGTEHLSAVETFACFVIGEGPTLSYSTTIIIHVLPDLQNLEITFPLSSYTATVVENQTNALVAIQEDFRAITSPVEGLAAVQYEVLNEASCFTVLIETVGCDNHPKVLTTKPLQANSSGTEHIITIQAFLGPHSALANISIEVINTNLHPPAFHNLPHNLTISESASIGTIIYKLQATDLDNGVNGKVRYRQTNPLSSQGSPTTINPVTGELYLVSPLNYEAITQLDITIVAFDLAVYPMSATTTLTIFLTDSNEQSPVITITNQLQPVLENTPTGTPIASVLVTDEDSSDFSLSLASRYCTNCFTLDNELIHANGSHTYDILVNGILNYDPNGLVLVLVASDNDDNPRSTTVTLKVDLQDVNERPFFPTTQILASVREKDPVGSHVVVLQAQDEDPGSNGDLSYAIASGNELNWFSINPQVGLIKLNNQVNSTIAESVTLEVTVRDGGSPQMMQSATVIIAINDLDDHSPVFNQNEFYVTVPETWNHSTPLFDFTATDIDTECSGAITYAIFNSEPPIFTIDAVSGLLFLRPGQSLDYESVRVARVMVRARSQGDNPNALADATLVLNITNEDDNSPVLDPPGCPCWITENQPAPVSCPPLTAHDPDSANSILQFNIVSGNELGNFIINSSTGVVLTTSALDHEVQDSYALTISVQDDAGHTSNEEMMQIVVIDVNDAPIQFMYSSPAQLSVPIDLPVGGLVDSLSAPQKDAGYNALTLYSFTQQCTAVTCSAFTIDPLSGNLYLNQGLQAGQTFSFTVRAMDLLNNSEQSELQVTVTVDGPKNLPPQFFIAVDQLHIPDNLMTGALVFKANSSDSNTVQYSIVSELFSINSANGDITLTNVLTSMAGENFVLNISATDDGSPILTSYMTLHLMVYSSSIDSELVQNPGVGVCHYVGTVMEGTTGSVQLLTLASTISGNSIQYSILDSEFSSTFQVEGNILRTTSGNGQVFDRSARESVFIVLRALYSPNFHLCAVSIAIADINNNGPVFSSFLYSIEIYHVTPIGSSIFQFTTSDEDIGSNAQANYMLNETSSVFSLEQQTGILRTQVMLGLAPQKHTITVIASDALDATKTAMTTLTITILNTVNMVPFFPISASTIPIPETEPLNVLHNFQANDNDAGIHGEIRYCIASGNIFNNFVIGPDGELELSQFARLDYETQPHTRNLVVVAYDPSPNPEMTTSPIKFIITDSNDEPPTFLTQGYTAVVKEGTPSSTPVLRVMATDKDEGTNGELRYSFSSDSQYFSIEAMTGQISTSNNLGDLRTIESYITLTVLARDQGSPFLSANATVNVTILDRNSIRPVIISHPSSVSIMETTLPFTEFTRVRIMETNADIDLNSEVRLWISNGNNDGTFFLNEVTGGLSLTRKLDYEEDTHSFTLTIEAIDLGAPDQLDAIPEHSLTVMLTNVNDNYPEFTKTVYNCSLTEGTTSFTIPCKVTAVDADLIQNTVSYSIVGGNLGNTFEISSTSGTVSVASGKEIDHETVSQYSLIIRATDNEPTPLSSTAVVIVSVQDVGDSMAVLEPQLLALTSNARALISNITISENTPTSTLLFHVHAEDMDNNNFGQVQYDLLSINTPFEIGVDNGGIFLTNKLDYGTASSHTFEVIATGLGGPGSAMYTVHVIDVDQNSDQPYFQANSPVLLQVSRSTPVGTYLTTLTANDRDTGRDGTISYYIIGGSGYGYFQINSTSGEIFSSYPYGGVTADHLSISVAVYDAASKPKSNSYEISIILVENPHAKPFFVSPLFTVTISATDAGKIFGYVSAHRNGEIDTNITYSIQSAYPLPFAISNTTGALSLVTTLDSSDILVYNFTVEAAVQGTTSTTSALVIVHVFEETQLRPVFPTGIDFNSQVFQSALTVNLTVARVFATTVTSVENFMFVYELQTDGPFSIVPSTGEIYLTGNLASMTTYQLTVTASNANGFNNQKNVTVTSIPQSNPNTQAPTFSATSYALNVSEDTDVGTSIFSSNATDDDSTDLFYSFTKAETTPLAHRDFAIHPNTGKIYVAHTLDREDQATYTIVVEAWDGTNAAVTTLMVTITDVNDNIPSFIHQQSEFNINEDSSIGFMVGSVQAEDPDENPSGLTYYFADFRDPMSENLFNVTANGDIIVAGSLDREKQPVHVLTVAVRDCGSPPLLNYTRVTINIEDANDNIPEIVSPLPPIVVSEDAAAETIVFSLSAFDPDLNENGTVEYSLQPNSLPFSINSTTGEITVTAALDYETAPYHILSITVQNVNGQSSNIQLNVSVLNIIDTNPSLYQTESVQVAENLPPNTFVVAVAEQNPPHPVAYSITAGNTHNHFYMEPFSGIVRTARPLDRESIASYSLTVRGSFDEAHFSDFTVSIETTDENDNPPVAGVTTFSFNIPENTGLSNQQVFHLNFTDADVGTNAQIVRVEILDPVAAAWFRIDTDGEATLLKPLDREMQSVYNFETVVIDAGTPQQQISSIFISVMVEDSNDNFPQFSEDEYRVVISAPVLVNTSLFTISANDRDEGVYGTVEYSLAAGNSTGQFVVDTSTGVVSIIDNFDLQPYYNLTAIATDGGGQQSTVNVYVAVKYCSFAELTIYPSVYNLDVVENITIGHTLVSLNITDFGQPGTFEYMITTPNSFFGITTSGDIFVSKQLDREMQATHRIAVQVRDTSSSTLRIAQANVIIAVLDINDNNPVFSMSAYAAIVVDTDEAGKEVIRVRANDPDMGPNSEISYHLVQDSLDYFSIDSFSGVIRIKRELNPTIMDTTLELIVSARDGGHPQLSTNVSVQINIVNSNAPNFSQPLYSVDISESADRHDSVLTVQATAKDQNSILIYSIETNDPLFPLAITNNGEITVNDIGLDYERTALYSFGVRVTDTTTSLSAQALVRVNVLDFNDESPSFSEALYQITETENASIGQILLTTTASDQDSPPNAQLTYSLPANSYPGLFVINSQDGTVRTNGTLDYEMHQSYQFVVQAVDSGSPPLTGSATIRITLTNINDNPPVFSIPNPPSVSESSSPGTIITYIQASDPDGDSLTYGLFPSIGYENFQIGSDGLLRLDSTSVSLTEPEYKLNISASDGVHVTTSIVTVTIIDVNDHSPVFNSTVYNATVVENSPAGIYLTTVFAFDEDRGTNAEITYTGHLTQFNVNSTTGVVTTGSCGSCIDRETTPVYNLFVVARDGGSRADSATVVITVLDENDNSPMFLQDSYAASVSETVEYQTSILQVRAKDADSGPNGSVSYSIDGGTNLFSITTTGWIQAIGNPDFEVAQQHVLQVVAMDMGDPKRQSNPVQVTIHVVNQADVNPTFLNSTYNASIPENATFHTVVFETQIATSECSTPPQYSIVQQISAFSIGSSNGVVTVMSILDRAEQDLYSFQIEVQCSILDSSNQLMTLFGFAQVNIMIEDVNQPPEFDPLVYIQSIEENSPVNTTLASIMLQVNDDDLGENGQIRFRISDNDESVPFDIRSVSGVLFVTGELDHESDPNYIFKVVAYDLGTPSLESEQFATIIVIIQDINDQPPRFVCEQTNSSANSTCVFFTEIPENNAVGETIITLMVTDADEQSNISYSINSPDFSVDPSTGAVQVALSLDREKVDYFSLNVIANDGIFIANATLNINITDVNDNSPEFTQEEYTITLTENYPVDVPFINVSATDLDVTDSVITYSILTSPLSPNVSINPSTGQISFTIQPDREVTPTIELHLRAVDQGGRDDQATLVITLLDQNDEPPVFSMPVYTDTIPEELENSVDLLHVSATDDDEGINRVIIYSLAEDSQQYFRINNATGLVSSKGPVDREVNQYFMLTVIAHDLGNVSLSSQAIVNITVSDINDNPPVLNSSSYTVSISEEEPKDVRVVTGEASDADIGINAELLYQLSGNNSDDFQVSSSAEGEFSIFTNRLLNFEVTQQYQLTLIVVDGGSPIKTASAQININIIDANDNNPVFNLASYMKTISEDIPLQATALTVTATDLDGTDTIIYSFLNPGEFPEFSLDSTTGDIVVVQSLDYETRTQYSIQVTARNERPGANTATASVMIVLNDVNDNPPVIACDVATPDGEQCRRTISILENTLGSIILANFTATDADSVTNANAISFTIESGARPGLFQLTPFGQLSVLTSLDREEQASYLLVITASDNGSPSLTGTAYVTIEVQDINDNGPEGGTETIFIYHYAGSANPTTIGQVSGNDPDIINEHRFITNQENMPDLLVDENGLIVTTNTHLSPGDYSFLVTVTDTLFDGSVLSATSNVSIIVRDISDVTLTNSFIMLLTGDSISEFLMNNLVKLRQEITKVLKDSVTNFSEFYVFAVNRSELRSGVLEVSVVAVPSDGRYVQPDLIQHLIHLHQQQIEAVTNVTIYTEDFTPCNNEPCAASGVCSSEIQYLPSENFVNTDMVTLLGLQKTWNVSCSCFPGFTGQNCSVQRPSCVNVTCLNGGRCIETDSITGCSCPYEHVGTRCEIKRNPPDLCRITTCGNGECTFSESGFTCTCPSDYTGNTCTTETSQNSGGCFVNPCRHGGTCVWDNSEQTTYTCQCPPGYSGMDCQTRLYAETCDSSVAEENCQCVYTASKGLCQFTQVCKMDSCEDTQSCIQEQRTFTCVDDCQPNPCSNGGTCIRQFPGYFCSCRDGFDGPKCELTTATFTGSTSVLFPSVPLRGMEEITLDFITEQENGLLLLAGRLDNDTTDYFELNIFNGSLRLMTSLGGTSLNPLTMTSFVSDRQWHTVSIKYTTMVS